LQATKERNNLDTNYLEDLIPGCVTQVDEQGFNVARTAAMTAVYPDTTAGVTLSRYCASGLEAVNQAAAYIMSGQVDMLVAGGLESMAPVPMDSDSGALFTNHEVLMDHQIVPQGITADLIATKWGYWRRELDEFAAHSQQRAARAQERGRFSKSMIPVHDDNGMPVLERDETIRTESTADKLGELKFSFGRPGQQGGLDDLAIQKWPDVEKIQHRHHPGNSSPIVDGASLVLLGNQETGDQLGLQPRAKVRAFALTGTEPTIMLLGPSVATRKVLKKSGMSMSVSTWLRSTRPLHPFPYALWKTLTSIRLSQMSTVAPLRWVIHSVLQAPCC